MRHIIDAIAAQGRGDDTELLHVTKGEMAGLDALARRHFGRELPRNPRTGLKEASLFQDWLGKDVGAVADVAAPVAVAFIPGVGPVAATALGAGIGAANQGLGKNGTTDSALMGGVMGGIGAYGGSGLAEGLGAGASAAAPTGVTPGVTPIQEAGAGLVNTSGAGATSTAPDIAQAGDKLAQLSGQGQTQAQTAMQSMPNLSQNTGVAQGVNMPGATSAPPPGQDAGLKWDFLKSKEALGPATAVATSAMGTAGIPGAPQNTSSGTSPINKTLPKSEVYYTPTGERRTRIVAADGGLMSLDGAYGDYDGAEDDQGIRRYDFGGMIKSIQPGGAWGDATANLYGAVDQSAPWLKDITPGGAVGQLQPGRRDWEEKQAREKQDAENQKRDAAAAAAKAQQQADFQNQWQDRYGTPAQGMAEGGVAQQDDNVVHQIVQNAYGQQNQQERMPMLEYLAGKTSGDDVMKYYRDRDSKNSMENSPVIRHIAGLPAQGMAMGGMTPMPERVGIANVGFAKGRYLQGPGDGMSDSIPANIDGRQEARLATGEFVVPADVVSGLGNGDSNAGAKQLHAMMDRTRQARTGTKQQGKQINPRKVMPT